MVLFLVQLVLIVVGPIVHIALDRAANRRTLGRGAQLVVLWILGVIGVFSIIGGIGHIGPDAAEHAADIGPDFVPGMFQWELGWNDIAVGVVCLLALRHRNRGGWLDAAVWVFAISYTGDLIGHYTQYFMHDNHAPNNAWAIPTETVAVLGAVLAWAVFRSRISRAEAIAPAAAG